VRLLLRGGDDVCLNNVSVKYSRGGTFNAAHKFCLGDDAQSPAAFMTPQRIRFEKSDGSPVQSKNPFGLQDPGLPGTNCSGGAFKICQ
jgi:hypothetical protein